MASLLAQGFRGDGHLGAAPASAPEAPQRTPAALLALSDRDVDSMALGNAKTAGTLVWALATLGERYSSMSSGGLLRTRDAAQRLKLVLAERRQDAAEAGAGQDADADDGMGVGPTIHFLTTGQAGDGLHGDGRDGDGHDGDGRGDYDGDGHERDGHERDGHDGDGHDRDGRGDYDGDGHERDGHDGDGHDRYGHDRDGRGDYDGRDDDGRVDAGHDRDGDDGRDGGGDDGDGDGDGDGMRAEPAEPAWPAGPPFSADDLLAGREAERAMVNARDSFGPRDIAEVLLAKIARKHGGGSSSKALYEAVREWARRTGPAAAQVRPYQTFRSTTVAAFGSGVDGDGTYSRTLQLQLRPTRSLPARNINVVVQYRSLRPAIGDLLMYALERDDSCFAPRNDVDAHGRPVLRDLANGKWWKRNHENYCKTYDKRVYSGCFVVPVILMSDALSLGANSRWKLGTSVWLVFIAGARPAFISALLLANTVLLRACIRLLLLRRLTFPTGFS